jgi:predicted MFS family arabinose efflux permease
MPWHGLRLAEPNRWLILCVLFLARTAMGFQFQSIASVSPLLMDALGIDFALLGVLIGIWMMPGVFVAIPGGLLGRRFGDKAVVIAGLALMVLGSFVVAGASGYSAAMVGRLVSGAGAVVLNVLLAKMVADWFHDRELATAMGILVTSWPLGIGLALVVLGPLAVSASWSLAIQASAWVCAAALVAMALAYRAPRGHAPAASAPSWRMSRRDLALACVSGVIWMLYNVAYIVVVSFTPVLLAQKGTEVASATIVASFATWPLILTVPIGGYLADRTGRGREIMLGCFVAMAAIMPLMLAAPSPLVALAIFGLIAGPAAGIIVALPAQALAPGSRHLGLGIFYTLYYLGMALLPGVAGWFRDASQADSAPLVFGSALLVLAIVCAVLFRRIERWQSA